MAPSGGDGEWVAVRAAQRILRCDSDGQTDLVAGAQSDAHAWVPGRLLPPPEDRSRPVSVCVDDEDVLVQPPGMHGCLEFCRALGREPFCRRSRSRQLQHFGFGSGIVRLLRVGAHSIKNHI